MNQLSYHKSAINPIQPTCSYGFRWAFRQACLRPGGPTEPAAFHGDGHAGGLDAVAAWHGDLGKSFAQVEQCYYHSPLLLDKIQGGASPVMWTLVYKSHEHYRYNPLINPSYSTYKPT